MMSSSDRIRLASVVIALLTGVKANAGPLVDGPQTSVMHCPDGAAFVGLCRYATWQPSALAVSPVADPSSDLAAVTSANAPWHRPSRAVQSAVADSSGDPSLHTYAYAVADSALAAWQAAGSKALANPEAAPPVQDIGNGASGGKVAMVDASGSIYPLHYPIIIDKYREAAPANPDARTGSRAERLLGIGLLVVIVGAALLSVISAWDKVLALWQRCGAALHGARRIVRADQIDMQACLSIDSLTRGGWSPELVRRLFGRPDYVILRPQGRREPLYFYDRERVLATQASAAFKRRLAKIETKNARAAAKIRKWLASSEFAAITAADVIPSVSADRRDTRATPARPAVRLASR